VARIIDLRSDTVTQPTEEMRDAMRNAVVGDDYFREDPTVAQLEELAAAKLGKEAGLFVVSGTMGNLVSILTHTRRGDLIILEADAHVYRCETAHLAAVAGVMPKRVKGNRGVLDPADVEEAIFAEGVLYPRATLVCVENTHNAAGGTCTTPAKMSGLRKVADSHGMAIHVDGARIFSAAVALGVDPQELAKDADSLTFCLSKNLACPFGSLIVGDREFIERAMRNRGHETGGDISCRGDSGPANDDRQAFGGSRKRPCACPGACGAWTGDRHGDGPNQHGLFPGPLRNDGSETVPGEFGQIGRKGESPSRAACQDGSSLRDYP